MNHERRDTLLELTNKLLTLNEQSLYHLEHKQIVNNEVEFAQEVKPFADEVKNTADMWKTYATDWVKEHQPKYVHPSTINSAYENLMTTSVETFYKSAKAKRYKDMIQSISYTLNELKKELQDH